MNWFRPIRVRETINDATHDAIAQSIRVELLRDRLDSALEQRRRHREARSSAARRGHLTRVHNAIERDPVWREMRG